MAKKELNLETWEACVGNFKCDYSLTVQQLADDLVEHMDAGIPKRELHRFLPHLKDATWARLERCGRGTLIPEFVLTPGPAVLCSMTLVNQRRVSDAGTLDVLEFQNRVPTLRAKHLKSLRVKEAELAIDKDGQLRDEAQQLKEYRKTPPKKTENGPLSLYEGYEILPNLSVIFHTKKGDVAMSKQQAREFVVAWHKAALHM